MIEVVLVVICAIGLYAAWSIVKYNKKVKEHERENKRRYILDQINKDFGIGKYAEKPSKKSKPKRSSKVSEDQVSNKRKYKNAKKKAVKSKVKKNAGRNKKKV